MLHCGRRLEVEPAVLRAGWRWNPRTARDCVALPSRLPAWQAWRLAPPCGRPLEVEHAVLRATPPVLAADGVRTPHSSGLCGSARVPARMASLAACSTAGGALRWSAQSCVPPLQVEHAVLRATPPVLAADGVGTPAQLGIVWLCPRDRRPGKPGGLLHCGRRLKVEHAVLRATPPVLAADGVGTPVPLGVVLLCRRGRRHGKPRGMLRWKGLGANVHRTRLGSTRW